MSVSLLAAVAGVLAVDAAAPRLGVAGVLDLVEGRALGDEKLVVAIFAPDAPFESGEARYAFASHVAQQIAAGTQLAVEAKAYARAADFEAAVKKGQVDLAILDGVYLAERGVPYPVLLTATASGETAARWFLFSTEGGNLLDLKDQRLAIAAASTRDAAFVDNALLDGELPRLFKTRQPTPDLASAVTTVSLHKADVVFAPEASARGLKKIFDAGRVPNPALVAVRPALPATLLAGINAALVGHPVAGAAYDGWKPGAADAYHTLANHLGSRARRLMMVEPTPVTLDPLAALALPAMPPAQPELAPLYFLPPAPPPSIPR